MWSQHIKQTKEVKDWYEGGWLALERSNEGLNQESGSGNRQEGTEYYTSRIYKMTIDW